MPAGLEAFLYIAALWFAAAALQRGTRPIADRLRATIAIGIAVPLALAAVHLLYAPAVWAVLAAMLLWRLRKPWGKVCDEPGVYATLGATLVVIWPPLVRPLLDGDTLAYHLPNAASWVQSHSLWVTTAPYWYYPPASEMFAAGLLAASGRWSLPLAGALPALLLTARLYSIARDAGAPRYAAAAVPLAFICMPVAAFQTGTLQNDVWVAAFFVEVLTALRGTRVSIAACALLKPFGWIEAAIAAAAARRPPAALLMGAIPAALWGVRDLVLFELGPVTPPAPEPPYWASTIAGNAGVAIPELVRGTLAASPQSFVWVGLLIAGFFFAKTRRYALAGIAALILYAFLPLSYGNGVTNFVADASSLRWALPALACGAVIAASAAARAPAAIGLPAYAVAAWGAAAVLGVFWNDAYTRYAPEIALVAVTAALLIPRTRAIPAVAVALAVLLAGAHGAASRAPGFYADWMRDASGRSTGVFAWVASHRPARIVAQNVRSGAVVMSSPRTRTIETTAGNGCALARSRDALLLIGSNEDVRGAQLERQFAGARVCGRVLYADGAAIVVQPQQEAER